jgi:hypothetical protein
MGGHAFVCAHDALPGFGSPLLANKVARARSDQSRTSRDLHDRHSTVSWPLYLAEHRSANVFLEVIVGVGGINPCFELGTIEHDDAKLTFGDARHFVKNGVSQ